MHENRHNCLLMKSTVNSVAGFGIAPKLAVETSLDLIRQKIVLNFISKI